jgi:hypothetical protein
VSQQINLFNPIFLKQKKYLSAATMVQALGLILLGCIALSAYTIFQSSNLRKQAVVEASKLAAIQTQLTEVTATSVPRQRSKALEDELLAKEAEVKSLQQVFGTLQKDEYGNRKGYSEYLRAFARQVNEGLWLTGFSLYGAGNEIGLQGRALRPELVPEFISRLKREPVLKGKSFQTLEMLVPTVERAKTGDPAGAREPVPAGYIEFSLKSSGIEKEQADSAGAKVK